MKVREQEEEIVRQVMADNGLLRFHEQPKEPQAARALVEALETSPALLGLARVTLGLRQARDHQHCCFRLSARPRLRPLAV